MKKVIINGSKGKMGQAIARIIKSTPELGLEILALRDKEDTFQGKADIIIDFSSPDGAQEALSLAKELKAVYNALARAEHDNATLREKLGRMLDNAHEITRIGGDC